MLEANAEALYRLYQISLPLASLYGFHAAFTYGRKIVIATSQEWKENVGGFFGFSFSATYRYKQKQKDLLPKWDQILMTLN